MNTKIVLTDNQKTQ